MDKYIVLNEATKVYDGFWLCPCIAKGMIAELKETWPGLSWQVEKVADFFPENLIPVGMARAPKLLRSEMQRIGQNQKVA